MACRNSPTLFPRPLRPLFPKIGGSQPHPKTQNSNRYYTRNGWSYRLQIWPEHSHGPSKEKPIKTFGEKGAWAYKGTAQILWIPPIISGTGEATDFKFGRYIQRFHPNNNPLKILQIESGRIQGVPIFEYPLLSQEQVKLRTSNFVRTFTGSIGTKAH